VGAEVGVEDRDELARRTLQPGDQGAGFEAGAVGAAHVLDVEPIGEARDRGGGQRHGAVGRVVEHLDLELVRGPVEAPHGGDEVFDHGGLVVQRQLDRNGGAVVAGDDGSGPPAPGDPQQVRLGEAVEPHHHRRYCVDPDRQPSHGATLPA